MLHRCSQFLREIIRASQRQRRCSALGGEGSYDSRAVAQLVGQRKQTGAV